MADRYWVGGTANWDASTTTNWSTSTGGAGGASVPTSSDNVIFDSLSNATAYTVTVNATANCADLTMAGPLVGAVTWAGSSTLNVYGSMNLSGGTAGITATYSGQVVFLATSSGKTIDVNGVSIPCGFFFNGASGGWTLSNHLVLTKNADGILVRNGTFDTGNKNITCQQFVSDRTASSVVMGTCTYTSTGVDSAVQPWTILSTSTFSGASSIIKLTGASGTQTFNGGGKTYGEVQLNGNAAIISDSNTFTTLTRTSTSAKTDTFQLNANQTVTGTITITGNSAINRVLVKSNTLGTARTITAATVTIDKVDFQDITGAGAASWDMSAAAGYTGDCGGNSMKALGAAAFTAAATCNWSAGTTWSTATWSNHSIPLPQDTATFTTAGTVTITQDMPRIGSVDFSTVSGAKTWTTSTTCSVFGSINLTNLTTLTASTQTYTFEGRGSNTLNSAALTWDKPITLNAPGGTLTLGSNLTISGASSGGLQLTSGTFDVSASNYVLSTKTMGFTNSTAGTTVNFRGSTHLINTNGAGTVFTMGSTVTVTAGTYTLKIPDTANTNITFSGGGRTYNNVWFARGTSTGNITIAGSNTFNDFKDDGSVAHSILFTATTTQTVTTFTVNGSAGQLISINSTTTATHALVKSGGGTISCDYLSIQHSVATPSSTWYAGVNSTDNQAVATAGSGWTFTAPPTTSIKSFIGLVYASTKTVNGLAIASVKTFNGLT